MQAEHCSQAGLNCNFFCQTCKVGGRRSFKESDEGFPCFFKVGSVPLRHPFLQSDADLTFELGEPRTVESTRLNIQDTLELSVISGAQKKVKTAVATHGTRDSLTTSAVDMVVQLGKAIRKRARTTGHISESQIVAELEAGASLSNSRDQPSLEHAW